MAGGGNWWDQGSGGTTYDPSKSPTSEPNATWLRQHGFDPNTFGKNPSGGSLPEGWVVNPRTGGLIPQGTSAHGGGGIPIGAKFDMNGQVYQWNGHSIVQADAKETKAYWATHPNGLTYNSSYGLIDPSQGTGDTGVYAGGTGGGGGGGGSGVDMRPREFDDPRYWDLQYQQLYNQAINNGLDADTARQQALAGLIANRNNTAVNVAQTSADIAKQAAQFAANPRDTYAEALYRNQVQGTTPFGDLNNPAFGEYEKALAQKAQDIFAPVNRDLGMARTYANSIPPTEFFGPETRQQLGLPPTAAQAMVGGVGTAPPAAAAAPPNPLQGLQSMANATPDEARVLQWLNATRGMATGGTIDVHGMRVKRPNYSTGNVATGGFAQGGQVDVGNPTRFGGYQPPSSEGGTNMNIHEPAVIIGLHSGHPYAMVAENGYPEQIKITPTPSGKKAAQEAQKAQSAIKGFAQGGTVTSNPTLEDMNKQYSMLLERLGGPGGGSTTPLGGARFLAGAPANQIMADPFLQGITEASYSMKGIDPAELWAQVKQYTPQGIINNLPRVNFA